MEKIINHPLLLPSKIELTNTRSRKLVPPFFQSFTNSLPFPQLSNSRRGTVSKHIRVSQTRAHFSNSGTKRGGKSSVGGSLSEKEQLSRRIPDTAVLIISMGPDTGPRKFWPRLFTLGSVEPKSGSCFIEIFWNLFL